MDTDNPYASPLVQCRLPAAGSDTATAWRDGDLLLIRRRGGALPKACIKTNRGEPLLSYSITTLTNRSALVVLALFGLPFVGLLLGCLMVLMLIRRGKSANTTVWLKPRIAIRFWAYDLATVLLILTGNLLSGGGILEGHAVGLIAGMLCTLTGIAVSMLPFQWLAFLRLELKPPDLVCIHGAHREYLDRLAPMDYVLNAAPGNRDGMAIAG